MKTSFGNLFAAIAAQLEAFFGGHKPPGWRQLPQFRGPTPMVRSRAPNSNAAAREVDGLPHGISGAKLARRAAERRITKHW